MSQDDYGRVADVADAALVSVISQDDKSRTVKSLIAVWSRRIYKPVNEQPTPGCYVDEWLGDKLKLVHHLRLIASMDCS
jgi:hypothetical protein